MTLAGPLAKLQRSFAYRVSKVFPSEMLRWMDRVSFELDTFVSTGDVLNIPTVVGGAPSLLSLSPSVRTGATVNGYYSEGDGGGGEFYYDPSHDNLTEPSNGGTIVVPTARIGLTGAWIRIWSYNEIDVRWFGAQPSIDTPAQAALNDTAIASAVAVLAASHGGILRFPCQRTFASIYYISAEILLDDVDGISLEGDAAWLTTAPAHNFGSWLKVATGAGPLSFVLRFLHTHNCFNKSLNIHCNGLADIGFGINSVAASGKTNQHCGLNDVRIEGALGAHGYGLSIGELGSTASQSSQQVSNVEILNPIIETCDRAIVVEGGQTTSVTIAGSRGILSGDSYGIDTYAPDLVLRELNFETGGTSVADVLVRSGSGILRMLAGKSETSSGICVKFESGARTKDTIIEGWTFLYLGTPDANNLIIDYQQAGNLTCIGNNYSYGNGPHADTTLNNYAGLAPGTPATFTEIGCSYGNGAKPTLTSANGNYLAINTSFGSATVTPTGRMIIIDGTGESIGDTLPMKFKIPAAGTYSYILSGALAALGVTSASIQLFADVANGGSIWQGDVTHTWTLGGATKMLYTKSTEIFALPVTAVGVELGASPAASGTLRFGRVAVNGLTLIACRNNAGGGDLQVVRYDTSDNLIVGDGNTSSTNIDTYSLGLVNFRQIGTGTGGYCGPTGLRTNIGFLGFSTNVANPAVIVDDGGNATGKDIIYRAQNMVGGASVGGNAFLQGSTGNTNGIAGLRTAGGTQRFIVDDTGIRYFNGGAGVAKQTVTGALVDLTATGALKSLLTALAAYSMIVDSSS